LKGFAKFDAVVFSTCLGSCERGFGDEVLCGAEHERTAARETTGKNVHLHVAFEFLRRHAAEEGDIGALHIVIALVFSLNFPHAFGPQGRETVEEAERIYTEEFD